MMRKIVCALFIICARNGASPCVSPSFANVHPSGRTASAATAGLVWTSLILSLSLLSSPSSSRFFFVPPPEHLPPFLFLFLSLSLSLSLYTAHSTHRRLAGFFFASPHRPLPLFLHFFRRNQAHIFRATTTTNTHKKTKKKGKDITMASTEDKPANKENTSSWKDSIYNSRTGEVLGRTACSWALILLFYLVFYCFLAGMFALTMWVLLLTLDDYVPKYRDRVPFPGLVIRPNSLDIEFNKSDHLKYATYVKHLESFLQRYNDSTQQMNVDCSPGEYYLQDNTEVMTKRACPFKRSALSLCSGLSDTSFGYSEGKPCVLLKMNRIIGLKPRGDPYINCTVKKESPIQMQYFPIEGRIDKMYFPYYGKRAHEDYVQPLVAVKLLLTKEDYNKELAVECRVEGSDLRNDDERDKFLGRVTFRIKVVE
ncbi:sodium/potassium-transporting ATPase subunit beta-3a [Pagrus major]|uniref:sodium/potassium-transporting ATPase subunit beta-3a n=1 Tax=Pagrus major TaxID=143350 RepID=UPI003CC8A2B0